MALDHREILEWVCCSFFELVWSSPLSGYLIWNLSSLEFGVPHLSFFSPRRGSYRIYAKLFKKLVFAKPDRHTGGSCCHLAVALSLCV